METETKVKRLLVAGGLPDENWYEMFTNTTIVLPDGEYKVEVEQARWDDLSCCTYSDSGISCMLNKVDPPLSESQKRVRHYIPDFVFYRGLCRAIGSRTGRAPDFRNILYGFVHAGIPLLNDFEAISTELDRPIMYSVLRRINMRIGQKMFPIIPQNYYPDHSEFVLAPELPFVAKVSFPHAGYGKMLVKTSEQKEDLNSILSLHHDYFVCEPYIERKSELRIVTIGNYSRAHKRDAIQWKVNAAGGNMREDVDMNDKYRLWVTELRRELPGLSYFSIDAIEDKDGNEYILEFNGSTTGLPSEHTDEYYGQIRKLVLEKMTEALSLPKGIRGKLLPKEIDFNEMYKLQQLEEETRKLNNSCDHYKKAHKALLTEYNELYKKTRGKRFTSSAFFYVVPILVALLSYFVALHFKIINQKWV